MTLDRFPGKVRARWFDTTTGDTRPTSATPPSPRGEHAFTLADQNAAGDADRIVVLDLR
ncbi:MAG: hypothetical protein IPM17_09250 [Verrucomicrobia bacterium]|nr:hypothetical protein [Verrucomicrobiota bacterium]